MTQPAEAAARPGGSLPRGLRGALDLIDNVSRIDGWLGALCLLCLTCLMVGEVVVGASYSALHALAGAKIALLSPAATAVLPWIPPGVPAAWEISSYLMAASFSFGAAMTLRAGGHIRVSLVLARLAPRHRRVLEAIASLAGLLSTGFLAWSLIGFTWGAFSRGQVSISSDTPLWIPEAIVSFGVLLLAVQFLARLLQCLLGLPVENPALRVASVAE